MNLLRNQEVKRIIILNTFLSFILSIIAYFYVSLTWGILILFICMFIQGNYLYITLKRYQDISNLSHQINEVLHNQEKLYDFSSYREGELSILNNEINKILITLKNNSDSLSKEKGHLSDSLADISHQLKTPLTSLNMISSFLYKKDLPNQKRLELAKEMQSLLSRIDWLITVLLKISQIDADTVKFKQNHILIETLIEESLKPFLIPLEIKDISLEKNIMENSSFLGDLLWTSEAIGNIFKNSIEHTPESGRICIECKENNLYTEIIIQDNGNGFLKEDIPHLFERFYKGSQSNNHSFGIGLALSKMIINKQEGNIKAENQHGARFIIRFYKSVI